MKKMHILLVEDNPADVLITKRALSKMESKSHLSCVPNGEDALAFLRREKEFADAPRPDLIFLDIKLPKLSGHEVLAIIKADESLRMIPVVVLTNSTLSADVDAAYRNYANSYVEKAADFETYQQVLFEIQEYWYATVVRPSASAHTS